jgi:hypothetical protein
VQFKDFYVLSLGKVDGRPSYYDVNLIFPVAINLVGMTRLPALFLLVKFWMGVILDLYLGLKGVHVQNFLFQMGQSAFQCKVIVNL